MNGLYYIGSQASMSNRPPSKYNTQSIKVPQLQLFTLTCVPGSSQTTSKCLSPNGLCCIGSRPVKRIGPSPKTAPSWGQSLSCSFKVCGFSPLSYFQGPVNGLGRTGSQAYECSRPTLTVQHPTKASPLAATYVVKCITTHSFQV